MTTQRVSLVCPECPKTHYGQVWKANVSDMTADYEVAKGLGLTADDPPKAGRPYVMVAWDERPGALQVEYTDTDELEFL